MATTTDSITLRLAAACGLLGEYAARMPSSSSAAGSAQQQLTIFYGGMVVVLDGCTPEKVAELIKLAAEGTPELMPAPALVGTPIARNASLRRFLSKRKERATAAPKSEPEPAVKKGKLLEDASWLALGSLAWDDPCTRRRL